MMMTLPPCTRIMAFLQHVRETEQAVFLRQSLRPYTLHFPHLHDGSVALLPCLHTQFTRRHAFLVTLCIPTKIHALHNTPPSN